MKTLNTILKFGLVSLVGGFVVFAVTGCETTDDTKIASAQACLDSARSAADATTCVAKVDGVDSAQASLIRCGGIYMQRNFLTARWTQIFNEVNNKTASGDPVLRMMTYIGFAGTGTYTGNSNSVDASRVLDECKKSGSGGMAYLSVATNIATLLYNGVGGLTGDQTPSLAQVQAALPGLDNTTVGNLAVQAAAANCSGSNAATSQCTDITNAIAQGGGDPAAIGAALKNLLQN